MFRSRKINTYSVKDSGAPAGAQLLGCGMNNQGLRLQVVEEQSRGHQGPLTGPFTIIDAGENKYSLLLEEFVHRVTNADEVLKAIRQHFPSCLHVANTQILTVELPHTPTVPQQQKQPTLPSEPPKLARDPGMIAQGRPEKNGTRPDAQQSTVRRDSTFSDPDWSSPEPSSTKETRAVLPILSNPDF